MENTTGTIDILHEAVQSLKKSESRLKSVRHNAMTENTAKAIVQFIDALSEIDTRQLRDIVTCKAHAPEALALLAMHTHEVGLAFQLADQAFEMLRKEACK
jgi:hypothetical protein